MSLNLVMQNPDKLNKQLIALHSSQNLQEPLKSKFKTFEYSSDGLISRVKLHCEINEAHTDC